MASRRRFLAALVIAFFLEGMVVASFIAAPLAVIATFTWLWLSYKNYWPTGPATVVLFGTAVVLAYIVRLIVPIRRDEPPAEF